MTSLRLQEFYIADANTTIVCDTSTGIIRPYIPTTLRRKVFDMVHNLSHTSGKATKQQIQTKFVWINMNKDITTWARQCIPCQRSKITRHNRPLPDRLPMPDQRFDHVHLDIIGPLPVSRGFKYCLTLIDRFSRWPEAIPIDDATAESVIKAFFDVWIARYGVPKVITTDRGSQFEGALFDALTKMLGTKRIHTTAYHPESNGLVERWHRTLKSAIKCQATTEWTDALPAVLLGLRTAYKKDIDASTAEFLFGKTLRLPGEFFIDEDPPVDPRNFIEPLRTLLRRIRPVPTAHHTNTKPFLFRDLYSCSHVFLRTDALRRPFEPPYTGPHRVVERVTDHVFKIHVDGKDVVVSTERLKPAYLAAQPDTNEPDDDSADDVIPPSQPTTSSAPQPPTPAAPQPSTSTFVPQSRLRTYPGPKTAKSVTIVSEPTIRYFEKPDTDL